MATDYYAVLGVRRDASQDEIKKAFRQARTRAAPGRQSRIRRRRSGSRRSTPPTRCCRTRRRSRSTTSAATRCPQAGGGGAGGFGAGGFGNFSDIMDAFFGTASQRGPRSRTRRGQDAMIRLDIDLDEAAFGTTKDIQVDTAVVCTTCSGEGAAPGTSAQTCDMCRGRGEVSQVTRSFLGQVMTSRPCPQCQGFGTVVPTPVPRVRGRRPRPLPPHPDGEDPGRCRQRHPDPARGRGRGRPRRRPRRRPVRRDPRDPAPDLPAARRRPALHGHHPDDGGGARHEGAAGDAGRHGGGRHPARAPSPASRSRCTARHHASARRRPRRPHRARRGADAEQAGPGAGGAAAASWRSCAARSGRRGSSSRGSRGCSRG